MRVDSGDRPPDPAPRANLYRAPDRSAGMLGKRRELARHEAAILLHLGQQPLFTDGVAMVARAAAQPMGLSSRGCSDRAK